MNEDFWNSLPQDLQEDVEESMDEATKWNFQIAKEMNEQDLEKLKKRSKYRYFYFICCRTEKMEKQFRSLYSEYNKRIGSVFLREIQSEINH